MRLSRTRLSSGIMRFAHGTPWRSQRQGIGYSDTHCGSCTASALRSGSRPVGGRACLRLDDPEPSPCTRRLARPFTFACDASGISGPRFGVIGFATPVSLLPSVIPPHLRSLPSTGITPLLRYSEPLRHPASPRPDPAGSPVPCVHTPDRASRVAAVPLFHACRRHYPGGTVGAPVARFPTRASLPRVIGGSASASLFSRPARRSLSLPPACSLSRLHDPFPSKCFSPGRYLPKPLRLLPAGTTVAGRVSHPLGDSAFPRRTITPSLIRPTTYGLSPFCRGRARACVGAGFKPARARPPAVVRERADGLV